MAPNFTPAIAYVRLSPDGGSTPSPSRDEQENACQDWAGSNNCRIAEVFVDTDDPGTSLQRPGLTKMLNALRRGTVLVVASGDRLAEELLVDLAIRREVADRGGRIEHADGTTPDDTPERRLIQNLLAAFDAYDHDRREWRSSLNAEYRRAKWEKRANSLPVGWQLDPAKPGKRQPCEPERQAIRRARELHEQGMEPEAIADQLTREIGLFRGQPWDARLVRVHLTGILSWEMPEPDPPFDTSQRI
jgi:DNA invertase Pin-like site-specific DNA recombinase